MPWLPYRPWGGSQMPFVAGKLARNGDLSWPLQFLIDTGAAYSFVHQHRVLHLIKDVDGSASQRVGANDASGNPLSGIRVDFDVVFPAELGIPPTPERFIVSKEVGLTLLGQTFFEKFAVRFHNFPSARHGRQFQLHPVPPQSGSGR